MAQSKEELAKALEALASGQADAHQEKQPQEDPLEPTQEPPPPPAIRVSRAAKPLPGKPGVPLAQRPSAPLPNRGIFLRQAAIPPMLTLGILMPAAGVASLMLGDESPLDQHPLIAPLLVLVGLLILGVTVLNMLHVRHLLSVSSKR